jgi:hypothetical protein
MAVVCSKKFLLFPSWGQFPPFGILPGFQSNSKVNGLDKMEAGMPNLPRALVNLVGPSKEPVLFSKSSF